MPLLVSAAAQMAKPVSTGLATESEAPAAAPARRRRKLRLVPFRARRSRHAEKESETETDAGYMSARLSAAKVLRRQRKALLLPNSESRTKAFHLGQGPWFDQWGNEVNPRRVKEEIVIESDEASAAANHGPEGQNLEAQASMLLSTRPLPRRSRQGQVERLSAAR